MAVRPIPQGYRTFTPHYVVEGASDFIEFLKNAFAAGELYRFAAPDGKLGHAEVRLVDRHPRRGRATRRDGAPDEGAEEEGLGVKSQVVH